jgi:hypothetical protein
MSSVSTRDLLAHLLAIPAAVQQRSRGQWRISSRKPSASKSGGVCSPDPDDRLAPDQRRMNLLEGLAALGKLHQPDLADLLAKVTGGRTLNFLKKNALEEAIQLAGEEATATTS